MQHLQRTALSQIIAGGTLALLLTLLYFAFIPLGMSPVRFGAVWLVYLWPVIPALMLILFPDLRTKLALAAGYFSLLAAVDLALDVLPGVRDSAGFGQLFVMWFVIMGIPTILLLALSNRAFRSVGLLAFLFSVAGVAGFLISFQLMGCFILATWAISLIPWLTPFQFASAGVMLWLAWIGLRRLSAAWVHKRVSDQSLTLDSWWLTTTFAIAVFNSGRAGLWTGLFFLPWFAYRAIVKVRTTPAATPDTASALVPELLLLRVFGFSRRSRLLLDAVGQQWRSAGPIHMIAGTDLATACFDPGELMQLLRGKVRSLFIAGEKDLSRKMADLDLRADADGRYRINEFFCFDNTWRATVAALAHRSNAVLMDLRRFAHTNAGCRHELGLLLAEIPLQRVFLLIDADTDFDLLEGTLQEIWQTLPRPPTNATSSQPEQILRVMVIDRQSRAETNALLTHLFRAASSKPS